MREDKKKKREEEEKEKGVQQSRGMSGKKRRWRGRRRRRCWERKRGTALGVSGRSDLCRIDSENKLEGKRKKWNENSEKALAGKENSERLKIRRVWGKFEKSRFLPTEELRWRRENKSITIRGNL